MNRRIGLIIGLVAILIAAGGFGYWFVLGEPEAPSAPIEAIPLDPPTEVAEIEVVEEPTVAPEPTEPPQAEPTEEEVAAVEDEEEPTAEPTNTPIPTVEPTEEPAPSVARTWEIDTEQSSARFELDEELQGQRITVVGISDQVAGQLRFDPADLASAQIGVIQANARAFVTDNNNRNRAIQNRILQTGDFEFITFEPTSISEMPDSATVGDTVEFVIEGNLTIRDTTLPAVFSAVVDFVDENTIEGSVATIITYSDFGINIPQLDFVANVEEELEIYFDFVATPIDVAVESDSSDNDDGSTEAETGDESADEATADSGGLTTWAIDSEQSTARFELDEVLRGEPITVVGTSDQVAGQMRFDPADLSSAEIGIIQVNARTFVTDDDRRNRAIQNRILHSGEFEFITFEPTGIIGMPESAAVGDSVQFDIEGNLTVQDVTLPVVFSAVVDFVDANTIEGTVATVIVYADFGVVVPDVPIIANVEDELEIYIDFKAIPVE